MSATSHSSHTYLHVGDCFCGPGLLCHVHWILCCQHDYQWTVQLGREGGPGLLPWGTLCLVIYSKPEHQQSPIHLVNLSVPPSSVFFVCLSVSHPLLSLSLSLSLPLFLSLSLPLSLSPSLFPFDCLSHCPLVRRELIQYHWNRCRMHINKADQQVSPPIPRDPLDEMYRTVMVRKSVFIAYFLHLIVSAVIYYTVCFIH